MIRKNWDNILTEEFLIREYYNNKKSAIKIANEIGCHKRTIYRKINYFNLCTRSLLESAKLRKHKKFYIEFLTPQLLYQEYKIFKHSPYQIAKLFYISPSQVYKYLKLYGICPFSFGFLHKNKKVWNLNKFHSQLTKQKISQKRQGQHNSIQTEFCKGHKSQFFKTSYKNIKMRSSYEVIYAKWLDLANIKWYYESKTFDLGNTTYTPDFYLPEFDCYIEIKGYWFPDSKKRFELFQKLFPNIYIDVITERELLDYKF